MSLFKPAQRGVTIDINLKALTDNLSVVRQFCQSARVFSVLKADAYGHGALDCAAALDRDADSPTDGFAIAFPGEAEELRDAGVQRPILVLQGPASQAELQLLQRLNAWPVIHSEEQCVLLERYAKPGPLQVWIKVDTGMGRLGVKVPDFPGILQRLQQLPQVQVIGILSHLASADVPDNAHTLKQVETFLSVTREARKVGPLPDRSIANSAAVLAWPRTEFDWVRPGIMLFGANPLVPVGTMRSLRPVMQVSAPLIAIKSMRRGDGIGYGQSYSCPEDMPIGIAAIGYGDGFPRVLRDATVLIGQHRIPIVGRVSMDSLALDMRGVHAAVGDRVILWGQDNPVEEMAAAAGTISYELLCSIRGRRQYYAGS